MRKFLIGLCGVLLMATPVLVLPDGVTGMSVVYAQNEGLVPCDGSPENPCDACALVTLADTLISFLFTVLTLIVVLMIVYTGFKLVVSQGDPGAWSGAKSMFTNVVIGFVIILAAWLIVDTFMKVLVGGEGGFGPWNELKGGCQ